MIHIKWLKIIKLGNSLETNLFHLEAWRGLFLTSIYLIQNNCKLLSSDYQIALQNKIHTLNQILEILKMRYHVTY